MGRVPTTTTVTVHQHVLSLALLPGVTGRSDVFAARREEVLAAMRPALDIAQATGGTVTVVAPALVARATTHAQPDLGASGYHPPAPHILPTHSSSTDGAQAHPAPTRDGAAGDGAPDAGPALHVTASAAVALLRLAGWTGEITTHEIGAEGGISAQALVSTGSLPPSSSTPGTHLLVFAVAQPDGVLPEGASGALAQAEQRTHALYHEVVALR